MRLIFIMSFIIFFFLNLSKTEKNLELHDRILSKVYYEFRRSWNTSKLGTILFKNQRVRIRPRNRYKQFVVLIWNHLNFLPHMHVYGTQSSETIQACSVTNCEFTGDNSALDMADAVVVHLLHASWPDVTSRNPAQRWIFYTDESPINAFPDTFNYANFHNVFNWSMTYRIDSDVPVPYGRMLPLAAPLYPFENLTLSKLAPYWYAKQRHVLVTTLSSHCVPYRIQLVAELKKYIKVDSRGKCGSQSLRNSCPSHYTSNYDCKVLSTYIFYLALENSFCKEYMTEKLFYNAYHNGAIPIIQGPSLDDCKRLLPPHSYLHVDNYASVEELANDIVRIGTDNGEIFNYHWWRNHFKIVNEHGYFGSNSFYLCRVCEALNYNDDTVSVYSKYKLALFLDKNVVCANKYNT